MSPRLPRARALALFALTLALYLATLGLDVFANSDYAGDEPHYLLAAHSLIHDRNVDVADEYADQTYRDFYPYRLDQHGSVTKGQLNEPHGIGFPLFIAPAYAAGDAVGLGGAVGVEIFLALIAALAVTLAYILALRITTDPWAFGAAAVVGLSPPFLAYGTAVYPELTAAAVLCAAALLALRLDEHITNRAALGCAALLGTLPWLGTKFIPAGIVVGLYALRSVWRGRRPVLAIGSAEVALFSVALYVGLNEAVYGGPTPYAADDAGETATDAAFPLGYLERSYRLVALFIDRDYGLLTVAPFFALLFAGCWHLYRAKREKLARAFPQLRQMERGAMLCAVAVGAQILVAAFLAPTMFGYWFPPRHLLAGLGLAVPLIAVGLRHMPRTGLVLGTLTLVSSAWLYVAVRFGDAGLVAGRPDAPFGPLTKVFPYFGGGVYPYAVAVAIACALAAYALLEARAWRGGGHASDAPQPAS